MNGEIQFGQFTLSTVVAVLMGAILGAFPTFPAQFKNLIAMMFGGCLGLLGMLCTDQPWVAKTIVIYSISGIMYGVQAIGTYNVLKKPTP
jgi:hypothetical protein